MPEKRFDGFPSTLPDIPIPPELFSELLGKINDIYTLRLILLILWLNHRDERPIPIFTQESLLMDESLALLFGTTKEEQEKNIPDAVCSNVELGVLLQHISTDGKSVYLLNNSTGRNGIRALELGTWAPNEEHQLPDLTELTRPTILQLYEENIGALTPMIADMLIEAENDYPYDWIENAIQIAVSANARSWRYINKILERWDEEGYDDRKPKQTSQEDYRKYLKERINQLHGSEEEG